MAGAELKTPRLVKTFTMPVDPAAFSGVPSVTALKLLPAANALLAAAMDRRVVCCDLSAEPPVEADTPGEKGKENKEAPPKLLGRHLAWSHENWVHALDVHPDGLRVATGGTDRWIKLWRWGEDAPLAGFQAHGDWVRVVAFSPDGQMLASAGDDRLVKLWDVESAELLGTLDAETSYLDVLTWSKDGRTLYAAGKDGRIHFWDVESQKLRQSTDVDNRRYIEDESLNGGYSYPGGVRGMTCSPDGKMLAAVGLTSLNVLDAANGRELLKQGGRGFGAAFHPSGRWLAFSREKDIAVWDLETKKEVQQIKVNQLGLFDMFFFDDGRQFAAGGCNGRVGIWDMTG